jgi:hypothetical protein
VFGVTLRLDPVPAEVPPQFDVYHFQLPPVPNDPPFLDNVVLWPLQIVVDDAVAEVAGTDVSFTVKVKLRHAVVLQVPSALT